MSAFSERWGEVFGFGLCCLFSEELLPFQNELVALRRALLLDGFLSLAFNVGVAGYVCSRHVPSLARLDFFIPDVGGIIFITFIASVYLSCGPRNLFALLLVLALSPGLFFLGQHGNRPTSFDFLRFRLEHDAISQL